MRVVFAGTPEPAVTALDAVLASRHEVVAVITRPDARAGRGRRSRSSPVAQRAQDHGIRVLSPVSPSEPEFLGELVDIAPECCPVVAYGALLRPAALAVPRRGWVNLHFSLLPAWRGAAPVQHAIMAGDDLTGASTFLIEEGLDTGPVLGSVSLGIEPRETSGTLLTRLAEVGSGLLVATLDALEEGALRPEAQPDEGVSHAPRLTAPDARVRWDLPSHVVERRVRGLTPAPGAWTLWRDQRVKLGPLVPVDDVPSDARLAPGEVRAGRSLLVGAASGALEATWVQPAGRAAMAGADWARGVRPETGESFS